MIFANKKAFKKVFQKYYNPLCNFANNMVNDTTVAEDIVQEVFMKLWEVNEKTELKEDVSTYLFSSVRNKVLEFIRARKAYEKHVSESRINDLNQQTPEEISRNYLRLEKINNSLRHLPPKCKNVFVLHKFNGLTYSEIAEREGISVKTVENHMIKAIKILRSHLSIKK